MIENLPINLSPFTRYAENIGRAPGPQYVSLVDVGAGTKGSIGRRKKYVQYRLKIKNRTEKRATRQTW